jgi:hypothetical protein
LKLCEGAGRFDQISRDGLVEIVFETSNYRLSEPKEWWHVSEGYSLSFTSFNVIVDSLLPISLLEAM